MKRFYDKIAESWYNIRHRTIFPKELSRLNKNWKGTLLNLGCAHGADFAPFSPEKFTFFGVDSSKELVKLSRKYAEKNKRIFHNCVADMRCLPFRDSSFDHSICIASLHHLIRKKDRLKALREIHRVTRGDAFITVWDRDNPDLPDQETIEKEWNYHGHVLKRRYYLYTKEGLEKELKTGGFTPYFWPDPRKRNIRALLKLK